MQYIFHKRGGGGQRPFGEFTGIHPYLRGQVSLSQMTIVKNLTLEKNNVKSFGKKVERKTYGPMIFFCEGREGGGVVIQ